MINLIDKVKENFNGVINAIKTNDKESLINYAIPIGSTIGIIYLFKLKVWKPEPKARRRRRYYRRSYRRTYRARK